MTWGILANRKLPRQPTNALMRGMMKLWTAGARSSPSLPLASVLAD